jgi:ABC-type Fe3+ transport system permease subunit
MSSIVDSLPIIIAVALAAISFFAGVVLLILFARSRKTLFLILGLLLTFILPGILLCLAVILWIPNAVMVYGPPPPNYMP